MRVALAAVLAVILSISILLPAAAQRTASTSAQAVQLLQSALKALAPNAATTDVTLSGSAHYIAGSDDETGTATLEAIAAGASRVDLSLPSGPRSEVRNLAGDPPKGVWSGTDGVAHSIAGHNLFAEPSWFSPALAITRELSSSGYIASYVGAETLDSQDVQHISLSRQPADPSADSLLISHLTQVELYLDSSTLLPVAMTFNIHPDDNAFLDIPIEVRFSDYRSVNGAQVPFHVQKFLNNGLVLDLQFQNAAINSGLSPTEFAVQ